MRRFLKFPIVLGMSIFIFCSLVFADASFPTDLQDKFKDAIVLCVDSPNVYVNTNKVKIDLENDEVVPIIKYGRTLVPVRFISESLGAKVDWNDSLKSVNINDKIQLMIGSNTIIVDGVKSEIDVPAQIINDRTYIPLRALVENLGKRLFWDDRGLIVISNDVNILSSNFDSQVIEKLIARLEIRGNTIGNINNYGMIAKQGDWMYFCYGKDGLYKSKLDGSQKQKLLDSNVGFINVVGDWIYCTSMGLISGKGLYKVKTDGSEIIKLSDQDIEYVNVVNGWIYYDNPEGACKPGKMRIDGSENQYINNLAVRCVAVTGGWIYFQNGYDGNKLYKMKLDGSQLHKISDGSAYRLEINIEDGWIYYSTDGPSFGLYKIRTDGRNKQSLDGYQACNINVHDGWIYYENFRDGLYKIKTDGSEKQKLISHKTFSITTVGNWLYYSKCRDLNEFDFETEGIYRTGTDGSDLTKVEDLTSINNSNTGPIQEVTVSNADELISAIGPNKKIILKPNTYNLKEVSDKDINNDYAEFLFAGDGDELIIHDVRNLSIIGSDYKTTKIIVEPRYANVLTFENSNNITISGITAGHTDGGECIGGVLKFEDCSNVNIEDSDLFGCGIQGLTLSNVTTLKFINSIIRDCSDSIMSLDSSRNIIFENSNFINTNGFAYLISIIACEDVIFQRCNISGNSNPNLESALFNVEQSNTVMMMDSKVINNKMQYFQTSKGGITLSNTDITNNNFTKGQYRY